MRIAIACSSLCISRGGSERAAVNMAADMTARGHVVHLFSQKHKMQKPNPVYELAPGVRHMSWDFSGHHTAIQQLRKKLIAEKFDVFLSMQSDNGHLFWAVACMGTGIPFILSERVDPIIYTENIAWNRAGRLAALSGADYIHELLPVYSDSIPERLRDKIRIIPNAAPFFGNSSHHPLAERPKSILFLARFCRQKRPFLLLEAFAGIAAKYPDWTLDLWGHGPDTRSVSAKVKKLSLGKQIVFHGECVDAGKAFSNSQIYCLPSSFEGFPNTVLEAMHANIPIVGIRDCLAMQDLVDGNNGLLADEATPQALAAVLAKLMEDQNLRESMGRDGAVKLRDYDSSIIYPQWEQLFLDAAKKKGHTAMDAFYHEPFASMATLSSAARREYLFRDFGQTMPYTLDWWLERVYYLAKNVAAKINSIIKIFK